MRSCKGRKAFEEEVPTALVDWLLCGGLLHVSRATEMSRWSPFES